jgi:predicted nucleic acid-binding protein
MNVEQKRFVLDSFALLVFLQDEGGMARVKEILKAAGQGKCQVYLSWINLGEVLYITEREQGQQQAREVLAHIQSMPIEMLDATSEAVLSAAHIKATHAMSYADAFAVAAAIREKAIILTGDPEFESVAGLVTMEWLIK